MTKKEIAPVEEAPAELVAETAQEPTIMGMLAEAVRDPDFDANKLEQLIMLKERVDATEAKKAFIDAMAEFHEDPPRLIKTKEGNNCKYAPLDDSIKLIRPALLAVSITPSWETEQLPNGHIMVTCILSHRLGHEKTSSLSGAAEDSGSKNPTQGIGSTVSYFKRYTLEANCGLVAEGEDTDGNVEPVWTGPLGKTKLAEAGRVLGKAIREAETLEELTLAQVEYVEIIDQLRTDLPRWYYGDDDSPGLAKSIIAKRESIEFPPEQRKD